MLLKLHPVTWVLSIGITIALFAFSFFMGSSTWLWILAVVLAVEFVSLSLPKLQ